jgi:hypothetical protein
LCNKDEGPCFTGDFARDLSACNEPFNGNSNCVSRANEPGYGIPEEGGKNMLTNKEGIKFTITELEVWEVKEMVSNIKN